jgi:hypothetical protein
MEIVMNITLRSLGLLLPAALLVVVGCSRAADLCTTVCECEHCNDWEEEATCERLDLSLDVAQAYDCEDDWDNWADCFESIGQCYESQAAFSTSDLGSCAMHVNVQITCTSDSPCRAVDDSYFCSNNTCVYKACDNSPASQPQACADHSECPVGVDRCAEEAHALLECEQKAANIAVTSVY